MPILKTKNENFFKKWTPEMAYVLGFIFADGALTVNPRGSRYLDISITDKNILEKIRNRLGSNHKIKAFNSNKNWKTRYRLQIGSKTMFNSLLKLGLSSKKTFRFKLPKMCNKYVSHFIRGYFDGDGSIWCGFLHKNRKRETITLRSVFVSGNKRFLKSIKNSLESKFQIKGFIQYHARAYRLVYSVNSSLLLYNLMYANASDLYLERKKKVFEKYLQRAAVV